MGSTWPLLLLWAIVGLIIYMGVLSFARSLAKTKALKNGLNFVNADPERILKHLIARLGVRVIAFVFTTALLVVIIKKVLPYAIIAALASAGDIKSLSSGLYALLSISVVALTIHLLVIFIRLSFGRTRLFY